ncbi:MAG TPA: RidA family protein [bacterium]|nr:RidA family protein [bacterium]
MAIERFEKSPRMSQAVVHGDTVHLAGVVADDPKADIKGQTQSVLTKIEALLAKAGTSKANLLSAVIYLSDMRTFSAMNEVWDAWVDTANPPARACVGALLARPEFLVEIMVVAAK